MNNESSMYNIKEKVVHGMILWKRSDNNLDGRCKSVLIDTRTDEINLVVLSAFRRSRIGDVYAAFLLKCTLPKFKLWFDKRIFVQIHRMTKQSKWRLMINKINSYRSTSSTSHTWLIIPHRYIKHASYNNGYMINDNIML